MKVEELVKNLCAYDKRNPHHYSDDEVDEDRDTDKCYCDNCFYGRTALAESYLKTLESQETEDERKLKNSVVALFMAEIKAGTSGGNKENLYDMFKQYGFTGPFTGLDRYWNNSFELLQAMEDLWDKDFTL